MSYPMDHLNNNQSSANLDSAFNISESLVPARDFKEAGQSDVSFDGLLKEPLRLKEDLKDGCGGQLWPAGMVLAKYMLRRHQPDFFNTTVVELGAGGGLVGLAVARGCKIGTSQIYVTDQLPMLPLMKTNIEINNLSSNVIAEILDWGEPLPSCIPRHPRIILAADCVYFEPAFPLLISTLHDLLGPDSICYFCFKRRRRADIRFMKLAKKAFEVEEIRDDPDAEIYRRENLFLYSIRRKSPPSTD